MARQPSLKLDGEKGVITNLKGEVIYVRRQREGGELYADGELIEKDGEFVGYDFR